VVSPGVNRTNCRGKRGSSELKKKSTGGGEKAGDRNRTNPEVARGGTGESIEGGALEKKGWVWDLEYRWPRKGPTKNEIFRFHDSMEE